MSEPPITKPLQKPPGYRDPDAPPPPRRRNPHLLPLSYQPTQKNHRRRRCKCISFCCFCYFFFSIFVLLLFVSFSLFYLWYNPKLPVFHLQSFQFQRFNVSENSDGTYVNCLASIRIEIKNANEKLEYEYGGGEVTVTVGEGGTELGTVSWGEFVQGKNNVTSLKFVIRTKGAVVSDGVGKKLKGQFRKRDLVVNVEARTRVGFSVGGLRVRRVGVDVVCPQVQLKQLDGGDMPKCVLHTLGWYLQFPPTHY